MARVFHAVYQNDGYMVVVSLPKLRVGINVDDREFELLGSGNAQDCGPRRIAEMTITTAVKR